MAAYYNENDPFAAQWLRNLILAGHLPRGDVDARSILDVRPDDLRGYIQAHFFAGIGGWSHALQLARWPDYRPVWTGSCPCQPFSEAGLGDGFHDPRDLWPTWFNLISKCCPTTIFGEQVANKPEWLARVYRNLEAVGYAVGSMPIEAASASADHRRDRFWFVAQPASVKTRTAESCYGISETNPRRAFGSSQTGRCVDLLGKRYRCPEPGVRFLADGLSNDLAQLTGFGNAIDSRVSKTFITAFIECLP